MKRGLLVFFIILSSNVEAKPSDFCNKPSVSEAVIKRSEFPWNQSLEEISNLSKAIYRSGRRLPNRAYVSKGGIVLPFNKAKKWGLDFEKVSVPHSFITMLKKHFKEMRAKKIGNEIIYSDLGHGHIFVSEQDIKFLKDKLIDSDHLSYYEFILKSENTKILYHTAEQLRPPENEEERHREENRTIIGSASGDVEVVSFRKHLRGHSGGLNIYFSASYKGCFNLDETRFDVSFSSPK